MAFSLRTRLLIASCLVAVACARDTTITHGADGLPEWQRRLAAAVPLGVSVDSARSVMRANGFDCQEGADSVVYLWCSKMAAGIVRRRWQAVINLRSNRTVLEVRASTGLSGP